MLVMPVHGGNTGSIQFVHITMGGCPVGAVMNNE